MRSGPVTYTDDSSGSPEASKPTNTRLYSAADAPVVVLLQDDVVRVVRTEIGPRRADEAVDDHRREVHGAGRDGGLTGRILEVERVRRRYRRRGRRVDRRGGVRWSFRRDDASERRRSSRCEHDGAHIARRTAQWRTGRGASDAGEDAIDDTWLVAPPFAADLLVDDAPAGIAPIEVEHARLAGTKPVVGVVLPPVARDMRRDEWVRTPIGTDDEARTFITGVAP